MFRPHIDEFWTAVLAAVCLLLLAANAEAAGLRAPEPAGPAPEARVASVPAFSWSRVKGADRYEFQLAADPNFGSIVLGRGSGSFTTRNLAATVTKSLPDGTYWWRVRAISARNDAGAWSAKRSLVKTWGPAPAPLGPSTGGDVLFPSSPLVLRWSAVPRAFKYRVWIATDPDLGTLALGREPVETSATAFSPGSSLPPGRYHWAVQPVDAAGHRGARSVVSSFVWSWPSGTTTGYEDLVADARVTEPRLRWAAIPGAVTYQVEINHSEDFAAGSRVCCDAADTGLTDGRILGTSFTPKRILPNNVYHWRVRGLDADGNAGRWNSGSPFDKRFGSVPPTVANLHLRDELGPLAVGATTDTPLVDWDPVPGAASYVVQVAPVQFGGCNWATTSTSEYWDVETAGTAWSPLAPRRSGTMPFETSGKSVLLDGGKGFVPGRGYCVRVMALSGDPAVTSDWTQLGGVGQAAFTYAPPTLTSGTSVLQMTPSDYLAPQTGTVTPRLPLLTWKRIPEAHSYYVVVAKDAAFTTVVDVALTQVPAYAPRLRTLSDDNTPYFWAVVPAHQADGVGVSRLPADNSPRSFDKRSVPPRLLSPADGETVEASAVFRWTSGDAATETPEGARDYVVQVAQDSTFAEPLEQVTTRSTSYTPAESYPADTVLYWRVRVADVAGVKLAWSPVGSFRRRLPTPAIDAGNVDGGSIIPALTWSPVQGASSYDVHVDQSDGTRRDFRLRGTAFTPTVWYGTGVWRWQVRANFPGGTSREVSSAYSAAASFARRIPAPDGVRAETRGGRILMSWEPNLGAGLKEYRVEFSSTDSFATSAQSIRTQNLSVAPDVTRAPFADGGPVYWRIAAIDEGGNVGGAAVGRFDTARRMVLKASGRLVRGRRSRLEVTALGAGGRKLRSVKLRLSGKPVRPLAKRTGKRGTALFDVRARRKGTVVLRGTRDGFRPATLRLPVA